MILPSVKPRATASGLKSLTDGLRSNNPMYSLLPGKRIIAGARRQCAPAAALALSLDRNLGTDFDDPTGWNLEVIGGVVGASGKCDKQMILPGRHAGLWGAPQGPPRQEE